MSSSRPPPSTAGHHRRRTEKGVLVPAPSAGCARSPDYGPLNAIARHRVDLNRIRASWPDMLRVAGSLVTSQVRAYDLRAPADSGAQVSRTTVVNCWRQCWPLRQR
ncbi:MAG: Tn3 family transposase [Acetobacteraceae bacterium]|nr:Tn3 family transposase [Acetobacteraceae bacterium]